MTFTDMNNSNSTSSIASNTYKKTTEYADTAYNGKANPYYRENIAPPEQRKRYLP